MLHLNYRLDGPDSAPVLVLSNSIAATLSMWEPQMEALSRSYRVLRYDTRGHGQSDVPEGAYSIDDLGGDVIGLLDMLGIGRVHFCGLSLGGMTGMWLAQNHPQRLDKLVLSNCVPHIGNPDIWNPRIAAVLQDGMQQAGATQASRWFKPDFQAEYPQRYRELEQEAMDTPAKGYAGCCAVLRDADLSRRLDDIASPTLVIGGAHDLPTPPAKVKDLAQRIPGAKYVEVDGGHLANVDASQAYTAAVLEFLG
jgi:3-oxoadipate enol-lactonase